MKINEELIGKTFYSYTIKSGLIKSNRVYYKCECLECHKEFETRYDKIANYDLLVCCPKCSVKVRKTKYPKKTVTIGTQCGDFVVLNKSGYINPTCHELYWECQCVHCGAIKQINNAHLKAGQNSCYCRNMSKGERKIFDLLKENNISFISEYIFPTMTNARFDFAIIDDNNHVKYLIEYDGEGHFEDVSLFADKCEYRQERDIIKNKFCAKHNLPLLRIPYWDFDKFNFNDIKNPADSPYLVIN